MTEIEECSCDSKPTPEQPKEAPKVEAEIPSWAQSLTDGFAKLQTDYASISGKLEALKAVEIQAGVRQETPKPTATISKDDSGPTMSIQRAVEKVQDWMNGSRDTSCNIVLEHDQLRSFIVSKQKTRNGVEETFNSTVDVNGKIQEALTFTGTHSGINYDTDVLLEPSSKNFVPVGQFARTKVLGMGETIARFLKAGVPTEVSQSAGTTATEGTIDLESVDITPSTITGNYFKVDSDDIEDKAVDLVNLVVTHSAMNYEDFIATDMLTTVSAQGTLTPGLWVNAETGATVIHSDTASITLEPTGIAAAKKYLMDTGYLRPGVKPILAIHPGQWQDLVTSTNITTWIQQGDPSIIRTGDIEEILGCRILVTNTVENKDNTTNDAYNALMFIPGHSYGLGIKRSVKFSFHEVPEDNQIRVVNNWRAKTGVLDASSIVRLSSTSPTL